MQKRLSCVAFRFITRSGCGINRAAASEWQKYLNLNDTHTLLIFARVPKENMVFLGWDSKRCMEA